MVSTTEDIQFNLQVISKTWSRDSHGLFDYELQAINNQTDTIVDQAALYRTNDQLKICKESSSNNTIEDRHLCSYTKSEGNHYIINPVNHHMEPTEENINELQNKIWYVIKNDVMSPNPMTEIPPNNNSSTQHVGNEAYPLAIGDIIKLGRVKYAITEIKINDQVKAIEKDDKLPVFNLVPNVKYVYNINNHVLYRANEDTEANRDVACKICYSNEVEDPSNKLITLCKCTGTISKVHFQCLKQWMETKLTTKENPQKKVTSYLIKSFNCEICKKPYPLRFILNGKFYSFVDYLRPVNDSYIILESLNQIKDNMNIKSVQVITLSTDTNISIGRGNEADVRVNDISVSRKHAAIVLRNNGVYLYDHSSKFGTLVLMKKAIPVPKYKEVTVQIGRTLLICSQVAPIANSSNTLTDSNQSNSLMNLNKKKPVFVVERVEEKQCDDNKELLNNQGNDEGLSQQSNGNQGQGNVLLIDLEMNEDMGLNNINNNKMRTSHPGSVNNQNSEEENSS